VSSPHERPKPNELRALIHALREPVGSFVIRLALLDDEELSDDAQEHIDAMLSSVQRMIRALTEMTSRFELDRGESTPLAILSDERISHL
jgi:signal transduction histidine kinase